MKKIAFYLPRQNFIKVAAPVIDYILTHHKLAYEPLVIIPAWQSSKPHLSLKQSQVYSLFGDRVKSVLLESWSDFSRAVADNSVETVVTVTPRLADISASQAATVLADTRSIGVKWISLPYVFEELLALHSDPANILQTWDYICTSGPIALDWLAMHFGDQDIMKQVLKKVKVVGYPELDGLDHMNETVIRKKYCLPKDKPCIYLSTAPRITGYSRGSGITSLSNTILYNGLESRFRGREGSLDLACSLASRLRFPMYISYRKYLDGLRKFADGNGACIIAKTREKNADPEYLSQYADFVISDVSYYPFTTLELMSISKLYFGFQSASIIESLTVGLYSITALLRPATSFPKNSVLRFIYLDPGKLYSLSGLSKIIDSTKLASRAELRHFSSSNLSEYKVDSETRDKLLDDFVSFRGSSSKEFLNVISMST